MCTIVMERDLEMVTRYVPGSCTLRIVCFFFFMQFMHTVLYIQLLIMPTLVVSGRCIYSLLLNTQVKASGAFNEFLKNKSSEPHILTHLQPYFKCLMDSSLWSGS